MRFFFFLLFFNIAVCSAQTPAGWNVKIEDEQGKPLPGATVQLFRSGDGVLVKTGLSNEQGVAILHNISNGYYYFSITHTAFETLKSKPLEPPAGNILTTFQLKTAARALQGVTVAARKPFIEQAQGKIIINADAVASNAGTTVLELLEKSPGVIVDRNGGISLQSKPGVLVMIDDKPTYLSGAELANMLGNMNSSQVDKIELITNPSAKYDAAGNAGIINIKTKKTKQKGFNGNATLTAGHGRYYKNNNNLLLNYRNGNYNLFFNYSNNNNKNYTSIYALRKYFNAGGAVQSLLDQPTMMTSTGNSHNAKLGMDYFLTPKTTIGFVAGGILSRRTSNNTATATWLNAAGAVDSAIYTTTNGSNDFDNLTVNVNGRHNLNKNQDLSLDIDWLRYSLDSRQLFTNQLQSPGGYTDQSDAKVPASIRILSAKLDYTLRWGKNGKLESGTKASNTHTDNLAAYRKSDGGNWGEDNNKSNHFLYKENIVALYSSVEQQFSKWSYQAGLRYENTSYTANQLGNAVQKDSAFSRSYGALFPSGYISYTLDSNHALTFTVSRRLDRPAFQKLNPFILIINKYTHQQGNPFFKPQFSWNMEISHQYKQVLTTTISYSIIKDYFSQLFLNKGGDILVYSEGNVGRAYNLGVSMSAQLEPFKWWSLNAQGLFNYKKMRGYVWNDYRSDIKQFHFSMNNQFRIGKTYTAELSGFYTGRSRNDLQELLYPNSQLVIAAARPVLKKKGTLKISFRDLFHRNGMEGLTDFDKAEEYFILRRDTRVVTVAFTYRFGKAFKTVKRNNGSASDEMNRVGG